MRRYARITRIDIKNLNSSKIVDLILYLRIIVGLIPNNCRKSQNSILRILHFNSKKKLCNELFNN